MVLENRSEILFVYDAVDCNPNGNPLSATNEPRVDRETKEAIVTDVRLKRYLRDQLEEDGYGVFVRESGDEELLTRKELFIEQLEEDLEELLKEVSDSDDPAQKMQEVMNEFLENSADVRYFGATMSLQDFDVEDKLDAELDTPSYTGPVQFSPARSLNSPVKKNSAYDSLTSVLPTKEDKGQGGYDLDDKRLKYAIFPFYGVVNENTAKDTMLTEEDVERLDSLMWRALKNQTHTRSKIGQDPRMYMRVEYEQDNYQIGLLNRYLDIDEDRSDSMSELRDITDLTLDVTDLVDVLNEESEKIKTVHTRLDDLLSMSYRDKEVENLEELVDARLEYKG